MNDSYLIHYGIKGKSGRFPLGSGERPHQHDGILGKRIKRTANKIKRREGARDSYKLSNEELDKRIQRLEKEDRYKNITKKVNSGRGHTNRILKDASKGLITGFAGAIGNELGKATVKKILGK